MKKTTRGYVCILLSACLFSTMEVVLKSVAGVFAPLQVNALRFFFGGLVLLLPALRSLKKKQLRLQAGDLPRFLLVGLLNVCLAMTFYQLAVTYTQASVVAVLFSSNPVFVLVLAPLLLGEKIRKNHLLALCLELLAILIIVNPFNTKLNMTGVLFSLLAAILFALYSIVCKSFSGRYGSIVLTCFGFLLGSLTLMGLICLGRIPAVATFLNANGLAVAAGVPLFQGIPASAVPALIYISVGVTAGGFVCHTLAAEQLTARQAGLVFFIKPMLAPVLAAVVLREEIGTGMLLGILCFLAGAGVSLIPDILRERRRD